MKKTLLTTALLFLISGLSFAQTTIYNEDFTGDDGYGAIGPGNSVDVSGVDWTVDVSNVSLTATSDFFRVVSGVFVGQDLDGSQQSNGTGDGAIWESPSISISGYSDVSISLDVSNNSGGFESADFVKAYYVLDGGAETVFGLLFDDNGDPTNLADSTFSVTGLSGTTLKVFVEMDNNAGGESISFDNVLVQGTPSGGAATKLVVSTINSSSSPTSGTSFDVVVEAQDGSSSTTTVSTDTDVTLTIGTGSGALSGTLTGTISSGATSTTISGVIYTTSDDGEETGVSLTASDDATTLTAGTSSTFTVLAEATQLILVDAPTSGFTGASVDEFTVEVRRADNSVDLNSSASIAIALASGTGSLSGTTPVAAVNGVATFSDISFDEGGDKTFQVSSTGLTSATSSTISITAVNTSPSVGDLYITEYSDASDYNAEFIEIYNYSDEAVDINGYVVRQLNSPQAYTFSTSTVINPGKTLVISRNTNQAAFEAEWGSLPSGVTFVNSGNKLPQVNGGEVFLLEDGSGTNVDPAVDDEYTAQALSSNGKVYRTRIQSNNTSSWATGTSASATPGVVDLRVLEISGSAGWRLLSTPTTANTYDDLLGDIWTQGIGTGADVTAGTANVKSFSDTSFVTVDDLTANMTVGAGFAVYVYSDDDYDNSVADAGFPKTLSVSGTANTGSVSPTLNTSASAWSLVGNPYTSTIDWENLTKTDLKGSVYVYNTAVTNYISWNGTAGGLTDGLIKPFQGFFVQTDTGTGTALTIEEADKTTGGTFFKSAPAPVLSFRIDSETQHSQTYFSFTPDGKMGSDNMDALKLTPLDFVNYISVASESEDRLLDINNLPRTLEEEIEIPISINAMKVEGTGWVEREEAMTITWPNFDNIPTDWIIEFVDYQEEVRVDLREEVSYQFTSNSGVTQEKKGSMFEAITPQKQKLSSVNRFALVVRPSVVNSNEVKELPSVFALEQNYPNPFNPTTTVKYSVAKAGEVQLSVYNMMGQKVADLVSGTKQAGSYAISWNAEGMASGMYFYRLSAAGQTMTRQMTLIK